MKVKRYEGKSEAALMPIIMEEMGDGATIISVKQKPNSGFFGFFRKPSVIITAACEDDAEFMNLLNNPDTKQKTAPPLVERKPLSADLVETNTASGSAAIEESMTILLKEARKAANQIEQEESSKRAKSSKSQIEPPKKTAENKSTSSGTRKYNHTMVQLFYDTMIGQEVLPEVAAHILRDLENMQETDQIDVRLLVKAVYGSIVDMLKGPTLIDTNKGEAQTVVFMGPTGVGKTTTIAKLSSILTLKHGLRIGLITADTYRIAAVEQLKTYADILGLDIRVVYSPEEMTEQLKVLREKNDIVLIDTAGRSHKNPESIAELKALLDSIPDSKRYLVASVTTRYKDLCKIVSVYDSQTDFNLIFTKLDEAETLGSLMNICCLAGKKAAYVTFGQNVPDDLEAIKPDKIAKSLLGLVDGEAHPYAEGGL
ncbi:MAG: flagellar biosynthesis protein FlhF [Defluviitaleaceae bacterium]|nr:flagellar biosynthesis protein FlhF [Defluviitaleaceae bacterium]MCL2263720.1 flagellar biosynthesis protein FlhF [Defluviitaleaceae bacterium]